MKQWLRRLFYLLLILIWLIMMSFPFLAVALAARGQVQLGREDGRHARFFLVQERDLQGVGVERKRPLRQAENCSKTTVSYFMWEGEGENVSYCQCLDPDTGAPLPVDNDSCPAP